MSPSSIPARSPQGKAAATDASLVGSLAQFFPAATPLRLAVRVETDGGTEQTVIEFGTANEVMFASRLALEFGDRLRISNADESFVATAHVVALQFHAGEAAVAARFSQRVSNWIVK